MVKNNNILFKMTLREIKNNFKQYVALLLISFLAITLYVGLSSNALTLQKRVDTIYEQGNIADIFVYVKNVNEEDKTFLLNIDGISQVEERLSLTTNIDGYNANLMIESKDNKISTYSKIKEGKSGILFDTHYQDMYKKTLNSDISFSLPISFNDIFQKMADTLNLPIESLQTIFDKYLLNGKEGLFNNENIVLNSKVTGFMEHPEAIEVSSSIALTSLMEEELVNNLFIDTIKSKLNENYENNLYLNALESALDSFSFKDYHNQYLLKIKEGYNLNEINQIIHSYFQEKESDNLITSLTRDKLPTSLTLETDVKQARQLSLVFPSIFFIVAILVVLTTLSQLIYRSKSDIGIMKAIGISKVRILMHYLFVGLFLCFIGCFFGSIVGPLIIPNILNHKYDILYILPKINNIYPFKDIFLSTFLFCFLSLLVSFLVSFKEVNLKPVESTHLKIRKNLKRESKNNSAFILSLKMIKRNICSNFIRTLMVIFGVLGCTSLLVSGFGIMDTVNYGVNLDFNEHDKSDLTLTYKETISYEEQLLNIDNILYVQEYMNLPLQAVNKDKIVDTTIEVISNEEIYCFDFLNNVNKGIAMSHFLADKLDVKLNEEITLIYQGKKINLTVDYLFDSSYLLHIYTLTSNLEVNFNPSGANVVLKDSNLSDDTKNEVVQLGDYFASVRTNKENKKRIKEILSSVEVMCNTVKVFAILLSIVVTYNLALLNFNDRKKDIATLKVLGGNNKEIRLSLIGEILFLTLIGCILGLFFGYPLLVLILQVNQTELFHFLYHIYFISYFYSVLLSCGTSLVVNLLLARLINKVDAPSALKSVE